MLSVEGCKKQGCQVVNLQTKKQFGYILEGLGIENAGELFGHLVYFTAIYYILNPFDICILQPFGIFY
jgi:hypothetical protein